MSELYAHGAFLDPSLRKMWGWGASRNLIPEKVLGTVGAASKKAPDAVCFKYNHGVGLKYFKSVLASKVGSCAVINMGL